MVMSLRCREPLAGAGRYCSYCGQVVGVPLRLRRFVVAFIAAVAALAFTLGFAAGAWLLAMGVL